MRIRKSTVGRIVWRTGYLFTLAAAAGCSGTPESPSADSPGEVAETHLPLVTSNGIVTDPYSGVVMILFGTSICSGALLTNYHIITAKHCVPNGFAFTPGAYGVYMGSQSTYATTVVRNPDRDLAVLRLAQPMAMRTANGSISTTGYVRTIDSRNVQQLDGQTVMCIGYGHTNLDGSGPWGYERADFFTEVASTSNALVSYLMYIHSPFGGAVTEGDSGGPCLNYFFPDTSYLTGVILGQGPLTDKTWGVNTPVFDQALWIVLAVYGII